MHYHRGADRIVQHILINIMSKDVRLQNFKYEVI